MRKKQVKGLLIGLAVAAAAGGGIWFAAGKLKDTSVSAYAVTDLSQMVFGSTTSLEGNITSSVSQEVRLMDKQIVSKVYVQEGQEVKEGDPLLSYDMTLVNIDLEMEKLSKQQLEIKKKGLENELEKLEKDKKKAVSSKGEYAVQPLGSRGNRWKAVPLAAAENPQVSEENLQQGEAGGQGSTEGGDAGSGTETGASQGHDNQGETSQGGNGENGDSGTVPGEVPGAGDGQPGAGGDGNQGGTGDGQDGQNPGEPNPGGSQEGGDQGEEDPDKKPGEETPQEPQEPLKPSGVYKRLYGDITIDQADFPEDDAVIENAIPFRGSGTKEDPYRYLCTKGVLLQGAFLNWVGGFDQEGQKTLQPQYCLLEVHGEDKEEGVLLAAMLLDGTAIAEPLQPDMWFLTSLGKNQWEEPVPPEDEEVPGDGEWMDFPEDWGEMIPQDDIVSGYSKEELEKAITQKKQDIAAAALDLKEADIKIKKVEQKLKDETIKSTINGTVKKVGDPTKGEVDGEPFIVVESTGGAYVQGMVNEYLLSSLQPGQVLTGMAYESGNVFEAEIKEISPYPRDNYYMSGQDMSFYPFTAVIPEGQGFKEYEMVTMDLPQTEGNMSGIYISREFIRSKDGQDYVYKEDKHHRLVKQPVKTGKTFYGSTVEIKEGITQEDYLAFPYGKTVKEGAKVKRASIDEWYNSF